MKSFFNFNKLKLLWIVIVGMAINENFCFKKSTLGKGNEFENMIQSLKKSVVMIKIQSEFQFFGEKSTSAMATGFIINSDLGLIATNKHVTRTAPTRHRIEFFDGSVARGTTVYYDFNHDFGFIQLDAAFRSKLVSVNLGSSYDLKIGDDLMLIGNNEGVNYSIKYGNVLELNVPDFNGLGSVVQTSFDRTGGSSGSPVWNIKGEVVCIHAMGDKLFSFEVPIEYLKSALKKFTNTNNNNMDKSFSGVLVKLLPIFKLQQFSHFIDHNEHNYFNRAIEESKMKQRVFNSTSPEVIQINTIIQDSPAYGKLKSGDVIFKINEKYIGNDLILYEQLLDENINKNATFTVFRFGKLIDVKDILLISTEKEKIKQFIRISDTVIHPINFYVKTFLPILDKGLFISQMGGSSPFNEISSKENIVLASLNSASFNSINEFIKILDDTCDRLNLYIEAMDLNDQFPRFNSYTIDFGDLDEIYLYEFTDGLWSSKAIKLKKCDVLKRSSMSTKPKILSRKEFKIFESKFYYSNKRMNQLKRDAILYNNCVN